MVVTFCGHSSFIKTPRLEEELLRLLEERVGEAPADFLLGGYGGFDAFAYQCCKQYQKEHSKTKLILVTPYMTESYQINRLSYEQGFYDGIVYPPIEDKPKRFAILYRNQWMVEAADLVIAYVQYSCGGAYQTYRYAQRKKRVLINLAELDSR